MLQLNPKLIRFEVIFSFSQHVIYFPIGSKIHVLEQSHMNMIAIQSRELKIRVMEWRPFNLKDLELIAKDNHF